jgi:Prohead core protein serine protease
MILVFELSECHANKEGKSWWLHGKLITADKVNLNKRLYSKETLEEAFDDVHDRMRRGSFLGTCFHESSPEIDASKVSHVFHKVWREGNSWHGSAKCVKNGGGAILESLLDAMPNGMGFSTRSTGEVDLKNGVQHVRKGSVKIHAADAVIQPSSGELFSRVLQENISRKRYNTLLEPISKLPPAVDPI